MRPHEHSREHRDGDEGDNESIGPSPDHAGDQCTEMLIIGGQRS
jgi:hypothetical protein